MSFVQSVQRRFPFPPLIWYILFETILTRLAFFMVIPFVALRMDATTHSSAPFIGAVIGVGPLIALLVGFYAAHLSDLWGRRRIMTSALLLWAAVFFCFSFAESPLAFVILLSLNGLARGVVEPVLGALMSDQCAQRDPSGQLQKRAFHLRYYAVNIGSMIGPVIGATFLIRNSVLGFSVAGGIYLLSAICFSFFSARWGVAELERQRPRSTHGLKQALAVLASDRVLQYYLAAFFCVSVAVSQIDSILALDLKRRFGEGGVRLVANLFAFNGALIVLFTMPILGWAKRFDINLSCAWSNMVWAVGFVLLAFAGTPLEYFVAMFFMTAGEIIVFANGYYLIESLAPAHMKGAYMGSSNLGQAGVVIGPMIGGLLLDAGGSLLLFLIMACMMVASGMLYVAAKGRINKQAATV